MTLALDTSWASVKSDPALVSSLTTGAKTPPAGSVLFASVLFDTVSLYSPTDVVRKQCYPNMPNTNGLSYDDLVHLWRILGGPERVSLVEEQEFCDTVGCLLEQIDAHLKEHWVDYDIRAVLAGLEFVPEPTVVLVC